MKKFLIKVNGTQYQVEVDEISSGSDASAPQAAAPASNNATPAASAPAGGYTVTAPMPGTILNVNVSVGDVVKRGQVLLILEAMKMENEIVAPVDGRVASINVDKGKSVNAGDVLVTLA